MNPIVHLLYIWVLISPDEIVLCEDGNEVAVVKNNHKISSLWSVYDEDTVVILATGEEFTIKDVKDYIGKYIV